MASELTIVVPTYNEAENLPKLFSALFVLPISDLKILVVDDNSPDGTGKLAEEQATLYPGRISVMHRAGKMGLGTAYVSGFQRALCESTDAVAQIDADFSHPPEKLVELLEVLKTCDVALGSRYVPGGMVDERWPVWRKALSAFGNFYARAILRIPIHDVTGGFRVWRREALQKIPLEMVRANGYGFQVEMAYLAYRTGCTFHEVPFYFADRRWGRSKMSFRIQVEAALGVWQMLFRYRNIKL